MLYLKKKCNTFVNNHPIVLNAEIICIEFHQLRREWLLLGCYNLPTQSEFEFISCITKIVDFFYKNLKICSL